MFIKMNTKFSSLLIKSDVTAIKTTKNLIFAAIGSHLHIFGKCDYKFISKIKGFDGIQYSGIEFNDVTNQLLVYGENKIKVFDCKEEFFEICEHSAKDWIITAKWATNGGIVALTMHNVLIVYNDCLEEKNKCVCEENCILYSGFVCYDVFGQLVVFSGTVFSETLIWRPESEFCSVLSRLKGHKGVIFSIHCAPSLGLICTTSDDRTAMLWNTTVFSNKEEHKSFLLCTVNGHTSRIFRCQILSNSFATAGEDSLVNIWNYDGKLVKKIVANTGDSVWALDYDENSEVLLIGNGNGSIIAAKLKSRMDVQTFDLEKVRRLAIVGDDDDLVLITEAGCLFCFLNQENRLEMIASHNELKSYALLEVSHCKKLVALAGFSGNLFIYKKTKHFLELKAHHQIDNKGRIFSFHWLTCNLFLTCEQEGDLKLWCLYQKSIVLLTKFLLPQSKERWSTSACLINAKKLVVGDRKGNLHVFCLGNLHAVQTIKKAHSHLGVTYLAAKENTIFSMGRNGLLKTYNFDCEKQELVNQTSDKLPFSWLTKLEHYDNKNFLLGFTGTEFLIWDCEERRVLLQHPCGGGHRSWDFHKSHTSAVFAYLKEQTVNIVSTNWSTLCPVTVAKGFHSLEINALAVVPNQLRCVLLSGGEDTTFQITTFDEKTKFFNTTQTLKSHLSSIRCITTTVLNKNYAVFTAGGRAQIILWLLELQNNTNCHQKCSYYENLPNDESEMRIMDLTTIKHENTIILYAACSDGKIKVFAVNTKVMQFMLLQNFMYRLKCILKITTFVICNQNVLVTMNTEGKITFWNAVAETFTLEQPFFEITAHQSGVTSFSHEIMRNLCVFLTGGDDNAFVLHVLAFENNDSGFSVKVLCKHVDVSSHCAQITGVFITDGYFITTSIDQKVLVFQWNFSSTLAVNLVGRYNTAIADIQGLQVLNKTNDLCDVILYGKGIEIIRVFLHNKFLE